MRVPRILHCYWEGDEQPSWLRWMTLTTFARWNPEWRIQLHRPPESEFPPDVSSDIYRWSVLYQYGGAWSDLDILWLRPIEPFLRPLKGKLALTLDGGTPSQCGRYHAAIGFVAATGSCDTLARLSMLSRVEADPERHQSAGTELLLSLMPLRRVANVPAALLYPQGFSSRANDRIWAADKRPLPGNLLGLHWGGGHTRSRVMSHRLPPPTSWVAQALARALS